MYFATMLNLSPIIDLEYSVITHPSLQALSGALTAAEQGSQHLLPNLSQRNMKEFWRQCTQVFLNHLMALEPFQFIICIVLKCVVCLFS
jgi:hypothetical protein